MCKPMKREDGQEENMEHLLSDVKTEKQERLQNTKEAVLKRKVKNRRRLSKEYESITVRSMKRKWWVLANMELYAEMICSSVISFVALKIMEEDKMFLVDAIYVDGMRMWLTISGINSHWINCTMHGKLRR